jgi:hypothetical protein
MEERSPLRSLHRVGPRVPRGGYLFFLSSISWRGRHGELQYLPESKPENLPNTGSVQQSLKRRPTHGHLTYFPLMWNMALM